MLREWLVQEVILGALDVNQNIDGLFLDDYWCSNQLCSETNNSTRGCPCDDPFQGPTESDPHAVLDMGLSDQDINDITLEWNKTMKVVERRLLEQRAYTWWLMDGQENADAMPYLLDLEKDSEKIGRSERCVEILEDACQMDSSWQIRPRLFGFSVNHTSQQTAHRYLPNFDIEWAFFLLVRGPYSWAGWGEWGMTWPFNKEPGHGALPPLPHGVPLPDVLTPQNQTDYGVPLGVCSQEAPGVFRREWSSGWLVEIDCNGCERRDGEKEDASCHQRFGVKHRIEYIRAVEPANTTSEEEEKAEILIS